MRVKGSFMNRRYFREFVILLFCFIVPAIVYANEPPEKILEKFNNSKTIDELAQYLTAGLMRDQLASSYKLPKENQEKLINSLKMDSYETKAIPINENSQLVLVSNIKMADGSARKTPTVYEFVQENGQWKIKNRLSAGFIIFDLLKQKFPPQQFHTQNSFEFDAKKVTMESAIAYFENKEGKRKSLTINFYPFPLQDRDIEFLKYGFGNVLQETDKATAVSSSIKYPQSQMTVLVDEKNKMISFCQNGRDFKDDPSRYNWCVQPSPKDSYVQNFSIIQNNLSLITKGSAEIGLGGKKVNWDININIPLLKKDIN